MAKTPKTGGAKSPKAGAAPLPQAGELDSGSFIFSQNNQDVCWVLSDKDANGDGTERWWWSAGLTSPTPNTPVTWRVRRDVYSIGQIAQWKNAYRNSAQTYKIHQVEADNPL